nr:ABC transporter G family member 22-like isoform X1 [Ipomoea batatas]
MGCIVGLLRGEVGGDGALFGDADTVRSESLFWLDCGKVHWQPYGRLDAGLPQAYGRQMKYDQMKLDLDDLSSGSVLSLASSDSLGFTIFSVRSDESADSKAFSDDENLEDLEVGTKKNMSTSAGPTLPIYLKLTEVSYKIVIKGVTLQDVFALMESSGYEHFGLEFDNWGENSGAKGS